MKTTTCIIAAALLAGCASTSTTSGGGSSSGPSATTSSSGECGGASYYADSLAGNSTASGEPYEPSKLTAAHRTLPFGTKVRVTRSDNGKSVDVTVNDRGPFISGRVIDLSRAAAERIDMIRDGVAEVCVSER